MNTEHELSCDVLIAGGGPAGVPCALAAARCGAKVILCHDRPVLGGNASSEIRMHIVGADCSGGRGVELQTEAREGGIIEEIRLETAVCNPQRSASMLDLVLYDKCRSEPNLTLLLNTPVVAAEVSQGKITHAIAERPSTEDRFRIAAKVFIDCTGDGRLGLEAGAPYREGREAQSEHAEKLGQPVADNYRLGSTLLFQARKHDRPMPFMPPAWARKVTEADLALRPHAHAQIDAGMEYGYWWLEWGGMLDTVKDNEHIRDELLSILMGVWDHIKNGGDHGADHWALEWFGFVPGKRESRRFIGQHVLAEADVLDSRPHNDAIAYGGWYIDTHPPGGVDAPLEHPCEQHKVPYLFDIPLRSCVSAGPRNLMFAGRNISATHIAFASTRVMATCAAMGQGVGTAAAYAVQHGLEPADLAGRPTAVAAIQQRLLRDDVYLIGCDNQDSNEIAAQAAITASSEQPGGEAANILTGQNRAVFGPKGAPPDRARPGVHRWMSDPKAGLPAWLELRWKDGASPVEVQITFDTGLHRVLTLSHDNAYTAKMLYGRPQPECACDYRLEGLIGDQWHVLADVTGNIQRRRVHRLAGDRDFAALRVTITKTHGLDHARVCEVRVYEESKMWIG